MDASPQITALIAEWRAGNEQAFDQLYVLVYDELRKLASGYLRRERSGHTLQTTALVNEAYLKLQNHGDWLPENRLHFFGVAARVMRQILIDHARARAQEKRGGGAAFVSLERLSLDEALSFSDEKSAALLALDEALQQLSARDRRKGQVVELRFFGGLTIEETASLLGTSFNTVVRDWEMARAWLYRYLQGGTIAN
ncbi:MAG: sigma-70 family RNA polymerase sigma factor [Acidobacteria bacterium]|nr:sigma-70 family RNA polymerase sigma factor [Acidobacteriota bacterium]